MGAKIKISILDDLPRFQAGIRSLLHIFPEFELVQLTESGTFFIEYLKIVQADIVILDTESEIEETILFIQKNFPQIKILIPIRYVPEIKNCHRARKELYNFLERPTIQDFTYEKSSIEKYGNVFSIFIIHKVLKDLLNNKPIPLIKPVLFSQREREVAVLISRDYRNKEIAQQLEISIRTAETYRKQVMEKIGAKTAAGVAVFVMNRGMATKEIFT